MKFSFQTVWIIFGVTFVHLFAISALSPTGGAKRTAISIATPAVLPEKEIKSAVAATDSAPEPGVPDESAAHEADNTKSTDERESPATITEEVLIPSENSGAQAMVPVNDLVETGTEQVSPTTADPPELSSPPQRIREIRDLKPVRRS